MMPNGVTLAHQDLNPAWKNKYRIHIPITSNEGAVLISERRMVNFTPGYAWTFDNYRMHGVVNGNSERTHLIMDVELNEKMKEQMDNAQYIPGWEDEEKLKMIYKKESMTSSYPGDAAIRNILTTLKSNGWDINQVIAFLNNKGIPTKQYRGKWTKETVVDFHPLIIWRE